MEILGFAAAICIGLILGLIGGGGSILTVPILVYLFDVHPTLATGYSLFIVGITSLFGVYTKWKQHEVDVQAALVFGLPSMLMVFSMRKWILPLIPNPIFSIGEWTLSKSSSMMIFFAALMLLAALRMLKGESKGAELSVGRGKDSWLSFQLMIQGAMVGVLTGFVGVGGGFLIVPALVMFSKLPMKIAVGTSLLIIAVNSLFGFTGDLWTQGSQMNWMFLMLITVLSILGIVIGGRIAKRIETAILRQGFAWFVLLMGIVVSALEMSNLLK